MKTKRTIQIGDVVRDMTDAECAELDAEFAQIARAQVARTAAREALLTKLGITEAEAQLLLGGM